VYHFLRARSWKFPRELRLPSGPKCLGRNVRPCGSWLGSAAGKKGLWLIKFVHHFVSHAPGVGPSGARSGRGLPAERRMLELLALHKLWGLAGSWARSPLILRLGPPHTPCCPCLQFTANKSIQIGVRFQLGCRTNTPHYPPNWGRCIDSVVTHTVFGC